MLFEFMGQFNYKMHVLFFKMMLVILSSSTKYANFWVGGSVPLKTDLEHSHLVSKYFRVIILRYQRLVAD